MSDEVKGAVREVGAPAEIARMMPGARVFRMGDCAVILTREVIENRFGIVTPPRWHFSISHAARFPTWEEMGAARDAIIPADVCMCIPFPPRAWWLSIHPNCFHFWEIHDRDLVECWRADGEQAQAMGYGKPQPEQTRKHSTPHAEVQQ